MAADLKGFEVITPIGWGLPNTVVDSKTFFGSSYSELIDRVAMAVYGFVNGLFNEKLGGLHHYYRADKKFLSEMDSGNFLMALNFLVMYDLFQDEQMLKRGEACFAYAMDNYCENRPMAFWQGGVRDGYRPQELWVKYTGDAFLTALALWKRTKQTKYWGEIRKFHNFLKRAREAGFQYTFGTETYAWRNTGNVWRSFGFPVTAYLELHEQTGNDSYVDEAVRWGDHGVSLQSDNGAFYLLDGEFWNSDLTAPELRGLVFLWEVTGDHRYLDAAKRFADWLIAYQRDDGAWPLGIDRTGEVCVETIGPGDMPNIAISLIRLHAATKNEKYLEAAIAAVHYGLSMQAHENGKYPLFLDDSHVRGGFWSWEPLHDYSLSGDQSIHHIRGILFLASYLANVMAK